MMENHVWLVEMPAEELVEYQKQANLEDAYLYIFNFLPESKEVK